MSTTRIELFTGSPPTFDLIGIRNRRFMFCRGTGELILGGSDPDFGSHEAEFESAKACGQFSDFVRGWVGYGPQYPSGVLHFAPLFSESEVTNDNEQLEDMLATLAVFAFNGASSGMVLRGGGTRAREVAFGVAYPEFFVPAVEVMPVQAVATSHRPSRRS